MANPLPCKICETEGVNSLSDWLITAQSENQGFPPGSTFYVCIPCLAGLMVAWLQEQQGEPTFTDPASGTEDADGWDKLEGPVDVLTGKEIEPGALARVEADEGKVTPAGNGKGGKSKAPPEGEREVVEGSGQTATADDHS